MVVAVLGVCWGSTSVFDADIRVFFCVLVARSRRMRARAIFLLSLGYGPDADAGTVAM